VNQIIEKTGRVSAKIYLEQLCNDALNVLGAARKMQCRYCLTWLLLLALVLPARADDAKTKAADPQVGQSFEVPYLLTQTNHFVVRALINGKGPFHLVVDTGAPGLFLATEAAKKAGVATDEKKFFSVLDELKLEGGPELKKLKIRVEDPFQLVGMNSLGLPGVKLDGLMGFSVLARYRITLDPTHRRMIWTRLDFHPKEAPDDVPALKKEDMPAELQAMNLLGPAMKFASIFVGKQPETKRVPQGSAGFAVGEKEKKNVVTQVVADSAAAKAGLMLNDELSKCDGKPAGTAADFSKIMEKKAVGAKLALTIRRAGVEKELELTLEEGF